MKQTMEMVFFPDPSSLDSEELRFLRESKQRLKTIKYEYEECGAILLEILQKRSYLSTNKQFTSMIELCSQLKNANIQLNLQGLLENGIYSAIDEVIQSAEFVALEQHRNNLAIHIQKAVSALNNETSQNTSIDPMLLKLLELSMPDIINTLRRFYKYQYPLHYTLKQF